MTAEDSQRKASRFVANGLEHLIQLPLGNVEDLATWDDACNVFQQELQARFPEFELEHHVWHFFSDSDIRLKESGYRDTQLRAISDYICRLRS